MMRFMTASCIAINAAAAVVSAESEGMAPKVSPPKSRFFRMPFRERTPIDSDTMNEVRSCSNAMDREEDDFEKAEDAIFHAVEGAEKAVLHAVEDEVNNLFHELPPKMRKESVMDNMETAGKRKGKKGTSMVEQASNKMGWRELCPEDLREARESCLDGMME